MLGPAQGSCRHRFSCNPFYRAFGGGCCSAAQSCPTLWDPMKCSTPGFPVLHHLLELAQNPVHWVSDAIQPSHLPSPPSPPAFSLSVFLIFLSFSSESAFHSRWPKYWSFSFSFSPSHEYSGLISFRTDQLDLLLSRDFQECLGTIRNWKEVGMGQKEVSWRNKHTHDNTCPITRNSCSRLLLTSPFAVSFTPHFHSQLFGKQLEVICKTYL